MHGWEGEAPAEPRGLVEGKRKPAHREVRPPDGAVGMDGEQKTGSPGGSPSPIADNGRDGWEGEAPAEPDVLVEGNQKAGSPGGSPSRVGMSEWMVNEQRLTGRFALPIGDNAVEGWEVGRVVEAISTEERGG